MFECSPRAFFETGLHQEMKDRFSPCGPAPAAVKSSRGRGGFPTKREDAATPDPT
jgi:hypothetical protein